MRPYDRFGTPTGFSLGISNYPKPFAEFHNNRILPYTQVKNVPLDRKQILWAFFVVRSVVARCDLKAG